MGLLGSIGDFFSDVAGVFGDVFDFVGDVAETVYKGAIDAASWLITANLDVADFVMDDVAPYVAAAVGYYYGGPAGAQAAYNLAGGEGMGSSIEKQSPSEWAATVVSAYTGGEESFLADAIAIGYGVLSPDAEGGGTTIGGLDVFSPEVRAARLQVFQEAYKTAMREPYYQWLANNPAYQNYPTGGADADPDEANHSGYSKSNNPSFSFGRFLETEGGDYSSIEAIMANPHMAGTAIGDAYLTLEAYKDTAIAAQNAGVPGLDEPGDPDRGDDMYIIGGDGEPGGTVGDTILSGIDSILGLVGGQQEPQDIDIDITTTTTIQLPSEPAKMPSIRELDNLDQGLFAPGPLTRATRKVDVARAQVPSTPVKSMWAKSGLGITG